MNTKSYDKRPIWEQMGIKKFKRDGSDVFQWGEYEIVLDCPDCDYHDFYLKEVDDEERIKIRDFDGLAQFIVTVQNHQYAIPYPPLPTEQEIKIKEAQARLELVNQRRRELEREIERLKDGYEEND